MNFVLAVLLFQLLDFGNHPYSCRIQDDSILPPDGDQSLNSRVANELYPYDNKIAGISPKAHSIYSYWPDSLREQFDKSFRNIPRPSAESWYALLHSYIENWESTFSRCEQNPDDMAHRHFKGLPCYACKEFGQAEKEKEEAKKKATEEEECKITEEKRRKAAQEDARKKAVREEEPIQSKKRKKYEGTKILLTAIFIGVLKVWTHVPETKFYFNTMGVDKIFINEKIVSDVEKEKYKLPDKENFIRIEKSGYLPYTGIVKRGQRSFHVNLVNIFDRAKEYFLSDRKDESLTFFEMIKDDPRSFFYLGYLYSEIEKNYSLGNDYYEKGCVEGKDARCCVNLGVAYDNGKGVIENDRKAFDYYLSASNMGNRYGHCYVANSYYYGIGTPQDLAKAVSFGNKKFPDSDLCNKLKQKLSSLSNP